MDELIKSLTNREIAVIIWSLIGLLWALIFAKIDLRPVLKSLLAPKLAGIFLALALYVAGLTQLLVRLGFHGTEFYKDVVFWYFTSAAVCTIKSVTRKDEPEFLKELFIENLKFTILVKFVFKTFPLPLAWELTFIPTMAILGAFIGIADSRKEDKILRAPLRNLATFITMVVLAYAISKVLINVHELTKPEMVRQFLLEPLLTTLSLPFLFMFALWVRYADRFQLYPIWLGDKTEVLKRAKWRSLIECRISFRKLDRLKGAYYVELGEAENVQDIDRIVHKYANMPDPVYLQGEVVQTRIGPFTLPTGVVVQMAYVDWKNLSNKPVGVAFADIEAYDADGEALQSGAKDYCVFDSQDNDGKKIQPGETYIEPDGLGFVLLSNAFGKADKVEARITRLMED